jgi:hypothetical protein
VCSIISPILMRASPLCVRCSSLTARTFRDLFVPIDSVEKRLFDAIDGNCNIGDLVDRTLPRSGRRSPLDVARRFFERLWWSDQVVFDASH